MIIIHGLQGMLVGFPRRCTAALVGSDCPARKRPCAPRSVIWMHAQSVPQNLRYLPEKLCGQTLLNANAALPSSTRSDLRPLAASDVFCLSPVRKSCFPPKGMIDEAADKRHVANLTPKLGGLPLLRPQRMSSFRSTPCGIAIRHTGSGPTCGGCRAGFCGYWPGKVMPHPHDTS